MTREDLIDAMEIIIKGNTPEDAAEYIYRLWMNHSDYEIKKGKVVHITLGLDISEKVPRQA
jgi:tRNA threonylcarbamoyladenosine modification (KEOPS) complex  Pcc1 subunit